MAIERHLARIEARLPASVESFEPKSDATVPRSRARLPVCIWRLANI